MSKYPTFAEDIEEAAKGETIESVVIGAFSGYEWSDEQHADEKGVPPSQRHVVLSWKETRPLLDYTYDTGYGGADCHAIWAWTHTHIVFVSEYDGSTTVVSVPRNPQPGNPAMPGGG